MRTRTLASIDEIPAAAWNALAGERYPFLRHEFLAALEHQHCVGAGTGWTPRIVIAEDARGELAGAAPCYEKSHSRGEFVFDFSWARAYQQAGLPYYPKLVVGVPFSPVTGRRMLAASGLDAVAVRGALVHHLHQLAEERSCSSVHVLFPTAEENAALADAGFMKRSDCQFHWHNAGYASFDQFLESFTADKRKKSKRERRRVEEAGIRFETVAGAELDAKTWNDLYPLYADTFARHGHAPYLTRGFFLELARAMPACLMLKVATLDGAAVGLAIYLVGGDTLYGRYWGTSGNHHSLHFETCYYQGIDYCIEHRLQHFEPGTQGEHKVARGFVPATVYSNHWIVDRRFAAAIADYLEREGAEVERYADLVREHVPYKRGPAG
ncbi:MAG TPA: GNAT family N-acetyltransferase [Steroidobacteraceae bacterium]|nr:GNAT family N-acetyltransferase [Steroidobacteraceae bacterium]